MKQAENKNTKTVQDEEVIEEPVVSEADIAEPEIAEPEIAEPSEYEKLTAEVEKYKNMALRTQADFDNYRKRNLEATRQSRIDGKADAIAEILPVIDNFERAVKAISDDKAREGVENIIKQFGAVMSNLGVKEINAEGEKFDPDFHNAVLSEAKEGVEDGTVLEVLQKGYMLDKKVLRYAMVKVAKQ